MQTCFPYLRPGLSALLLAGVLAAPVAQAAPPAQRPTYSLDIPAQNLNDALQALALVSRHKLLYSTPIVRGKTSVALKGEYTAEEAVRRMLSGTDLTYELTADGLVLIRAGGAGKSSASIAPAAGLRLAVADEAAPEERGAEQMPEESRQVVVKDTRVRPYNDANADIPRTIDDVQPYHVFTRSMIERSGAASVEDFLKQRLTMNTVARTNDQDITSMGATSTVNLRGLGQDKTLVLVNGRRMAGVNIARDTDFQFDLNGLPLSSIERIEVLPSSASGIYGGSAIGGVVNVILRRDYAGTQLQATYDNTADADAPRRSVSFSHAMALEGGRSNLSVNASWSDRQSLLLQDRRGLFAANLDTVLHNSPSFIYSSINPWLGTLPNISPNSSSVSTLTLKGSVPVPLGSTRTHVPAGTTADTTPAELAAGLLARAGQWNLDLPPTSQAPTGLLRPFGVSPTNKALQINVRRAMGAGVDAFLDLTYGENRSRSESNPFPSRLTVPVTAPDNPFTTAVRIQTPGTGPRPFDTASENYGATAGVKLQLPGGWSSLIDYTWSENRFESSYYLYDTVAMAEALRTGALNPFVDTLAHPLDVEAYMQPLSYKGSTGLQTWTARASGALPALWRSTPSLTVGLEHRAAKTPERTSRTVHPYTPANSNDQIYLERRSRTVSAYAELVVPLISGPRLGALELQLAGRGERFTVDTGTSYRTVYYNRDPVIVTYGSPTTPTGEPYFSQAEYTSNNYTAGMKYQPMPGLTLRLSRATAFLPPAPAQLIENRQPSTSPTAWVDDPVTGESFVPVRTIEGGDPNLDPQRARSLNAGVIWEPREGALAGLRLNAEYYRIDQFNAIFAPGAQRIVTQEASFPGRVQRDGSGALSVVDNSLMNLYRRETDGWDLSVGYGFTAAAGRFDFDVVHSAILRLREQFLADQPAYEAAGYHPDEGGGPEHKFSGMLTWENGPWTAGWSVRYIGSYATFGAAGGPESSRYFQGGASPTYIAAQGAAEVASQIYHDAVVGYAMEPSSAHTGVLRRMLSGLTVQLGLKNVFDRAPPLDVRYSSNYYMSPFGDMRLRSYWLTLKKDYQ